MSVCGVHFLTICQQYPCFTDSKLVDAVNGSPYVYSKTGDKDKDEQNYQDVAKVTEVCLKYSTAELNSLFWAILYYCIWLLAVQKNPE